MFGTTALENNGTYRVCNLKMFFQSVYCFFNDFHDHCSLKKVNYGLKWHSALQSLKQSVKLNIKCGFQPIGALGDLSLGSTRGFMHRFWIMIDGGCIGRGGEMKELHLVRDHLPHPKILSLIFDRVTHVSHSTLCRTATGHTLFQGCVKPHTSLSVCVWNG